MSLWRGCCQLGRMLRSRSRIQKSLNGQWRCCTRHRPTPERILSDWAVKARRSNFDSSIRLEGDGLDCSHFLWSFSCLILSFQFFSRSCSVCSKPSFDGLKYTRPSSDFGRQLMSVSFS